ncbi:DJ-1/PfpI family protein [Clostridium sp. JN-9]|uniref:DJ-1/PfpI family protein n=1 Tax=Clostridium sp. JN-9 TaxID=2507159 RepID=UPI0013E8A218|nr:DJ-1/PfpI family protein [Clostridium sp. JN-9]
MNVYVLMYDECALFEIILGCYFLKAKYNIITVGIDAEEIRSFEGIKVKCDTLMQNVSSSKGDVVVIPGGNINLINNKSLLRDFLCKSNLSECLFGAICSGVDILKENSLITSNDIDKYSISNVKLGNRFVLAKPNEYVDFALSLGIITNIYESQNDFDETVNFFKLFKEC